jgi:uncharacterized iron-regulated protein
MGGAGAVPVAWRVAALSLVALGLFGCCSPCRRAAPCCEPRQGLPPPAVVAPTPTPPPAAARAKDPAPGTILDHATGKAISFDALVDALAKASVVYVGERHDQAEHHAFQARVFEALLDRWKDERVALGMEMFQTPAQEALNDYVDGTIDEKALLEKTEWATRWGFGWEMYAPMVRRARAEPSRVEVVALNAPKEVTRAVAKGGLESLTAGQREALPPLDLTDAGHRAFVLKAFGAHGASMPKDKFERFYTAQVIWEETMSSSVADWLNYGKGNPHMVVVVGAGHVADRFGVPARAAKKVRIGWLTSYATVVCEVTDPGVPPSPDDEPARLDPAYADFTAWFLPSAPPRPAKAPTEPTSPTPPAPTKP